MCDVSWGVGGGSPEKRTYDAVSRGHNRYGSNFCAHFP